MVQRTTPSVLGLYSPATETATAYVGSEQQVEEAWNEYTGSADVPPLHHFDGEDEAGHETASRTANALHAWQLTYDELRSILEGDDLRRRHPLLGELFGEYVDLKRPDPNNRYGVAIWGEYHEPQRFGPARPFFTDLSRRHRRAVETATAQGQPVPQRVLDDVTPPTAASRRTHVAQRLAADEPTMPPALAAIYRYNQRRYPSWLTPNLMIQLNQVNDPTGDKAVFTPWIVEQYDKKRTANPQASTNLGVYRALWYYYEAIRRDTTARGNIRKALGKEYTSFTSDEFARQANNLQRFYQSAENKWFRSNHHLNHPVHNHDVPNDPYPHPNRRHIFRIDTMERFQQFSHYWPHTAPAGPAVQHYLSWGDVFVFVDGKTLLGLYSPSLDEYQPVSATVDELDEMWDDYAGTPGFMGRPDHDDAEFSET